MQPYLYLLLLYLACDAMEAVPTPMRCLSLFAVEGRADVSRMTRSLDVMDNKLSAHITPVMLHILHSNSYG